jgi:hypothetical protein
MSHAYDNSTNSFHQIVFTWLVLLFALPHEAMIASRNDDPNRILRGLVPEIPGLQVVPEKDLEPNPRGKYRRYASIEGDFNTDGLGDIAIVAVDDPLEEYPSVRFLATID